MNQQYFFIIILIFQIQAQSINKDNRAIYYSTIAAIYGISELIPDHDPWISSDTQKQNFESKNTIPTSTLVSTNIAAFSLLSISMSHDYENDVEGLNNTIGHIEALIAEHAVTQLVKKTVQRERPNIGKDKVSFWSGHAAASFTTATYITRYVDDYSGFSNSGKWTVGILSFAYASYVSWTRVDDLQHHTSDVIMGAVWGIIASNYIYRIRNHGLHNMFVGQKPKKSNSNFKLHFNFKL